MLAIAADLGVLPAQFDDLWPWEIGVLIAAYERRRHDAERLALLGAHRVSVWVWAAFAGKLPALDELVPPRAGLGVTLEPGAAAEDLEARTRLAEARWTDFFDRRRRRRDADGDRA